MAQDPNANQQALEWLQQEDNRDELSLMDFIRVVPYQWKTFALIMGLTLLVALIAIAFLPKAYISQSSILMEREDTYSDSVQNGRAESLNLRIHSITATLLSSASVKEMLLSMRLITAGTAQEEVAGAVHRFKENVNFNFDNVTFMNENTGRESEFSLGFSVAYEHSSPEISLLGAQELTNRLLNYSSDRVTQQAEVETRFLRENMERAKAELDEAEAQLTSYKEGNSLVLPHMQTVSIQRIQNLTTQIANADGRIAALRDRLEDTEAQIASVRLDTNIYSTSGDRIASPQDQLTILELDYAAARNKYAANHPDIIRMQEEMAALRDVINRTKNGVLGGIEQELSQARADLKTLQNRYSEKHPDVQAQKERIAYLDSQIAAGNTRSKEQLGSTNLAYNNLVTRKRSLQGDVSFIAQQQEQARNELVDIEKRMIDFPAVEQELRTLERLRELAEEKYNGLDAELRETMETLTKREANLSERFVLLEPAVLPTKPSKPNKRILYVAALFLSGLLAYAFVFVRHMVRDTILASKDVESVTKLPVFLIPEFQ